MDEASEKHEAEQRTFFGAAKVTAALTVVSRVFGMLRAMAIMSLGANAITDAFAFAFKIPNLFRRLFAEGALSAAFVPVFTATAETDGFQRASRLFANALGLLAVVLTVLMLLVQAGLLAWALLSPAPADRQLLMTLTAIMLPFMVTVCLLALGSAALQCRGHFAYPAAAPILLNLFIIAAAWFVAPAWRGDTRGQLLVVSGSVAVAGVAQLAGVLWLLRRMGFPIRPRLRPVVPGIRTMLRLMAPMLLGLGFLQFAELLETAAAWVLRATDAAPTMTVFGQRLAKPLAAGVIMRLDAARYLYQFPLGVLAISLGVAVFPLLSRYAARGDLANLRDSLNRALRLAFMEGLAAGVGLIVLAGPITRLLYQRRRFTPADAADAAFILQMYALGMWAYCSYQIFVRAFYAMKDTVTPLKISCPLAGVHLVAVVGLVWVDRLGAGAFGAATAGTFAVNTLILAVLLRRRVGPFGGRRLLVSIARSAAAAAAMAAALIGLRCALTGRSDGLIVGLGVPAGAGVFILAALLLKAPELSELLQRAGRRP